MVFDKKKILLISIIAGMILFLGILFESSLSLRSVFGRLFGSIMFFAIAYYLLIIFNNPKEKLSTVKYPKGVLYYIFISWTITSLSLLGGILTFFLNKTTLIFIVAVILFCVSSLINCLIYLRYNKKITITSIFCFLITYLVSIGLLFTPGPRELLFPMKFLFFVLLILISFFILLFGIYVTIKYFWPYCIDSAMEHRIKWKKK